MRGPVGKVINPRPGLSASHCLSFITIIGLFIGPRCRHSFSRRAKCAFSAAEIHSALLYRADFLTFPRRRRVQEADFHAAFFRRVYG